MKKPPRRRKSRFCADSASLRFQCPTSTPYRNGQLYTSSLPSRSTTCSTDRVLRRVSLRIPWSRCRSERGFGVAQVPVSDLNSIQKRPVIHVIAAIQVHHLLNRSRVETRQPSDSLEQVPVRTRIIDGPTAPLRIAITVDVDGVIAQPGPGPLSFFVPIWRKRKIFVLASGVFFEGLLRVQRAPHTETCQEQETCRSKAHPCPQVGSRITQAVGRGRWLKPVQRGRC